MPCTVEHPLRRTVSIWVTSSPRIRRRCPGRGLAAAAEHSMRHQRLVDGLYCASAPQVVARRYRRWGEAPTRRHAFAMPASTRPEETIVLGHLHHEGSHMAHESRSRFQALLRSRLPREAVSPTRKPPSPAPCRSSSPPPGTSPVAELLRQVRVGFPALRLPRPK